MMYVELLQREPQTTNHKPQRSIATATSPLQIWKIRDDGKVKRKGNGGGRKAAVGGGRDGWIPLIESGNVRVLGAGAGGVCCRGVCVYEITHPFCLECSIDACWTSVRATTLSEKKKRKEDNKRGWYITMA